MKRLYSIVSLMAILNLLALGGLVAYAWQKGWWQRERLLRAIAVLDGEEQEAADQDDNKEQAQAQAEVPQQTNERIRHNEEAEDQYRIELTRREREIDNGRKLMELQQLSMLREREALEEEKRRYESQREELAKKEGDSGILKELSVLSNVGPRAAKELLKLKQDADVVRILMAMDDRKVSKIVKQCKTNEERLWIGRVLEKFHGRNAAQAEALGAGT